MGGPEVVHDLIPLWLLGPLILAFIFRATMVTTQVTLTVAVLGVTAGVAAGKEVAAQSTHLLQYAASGNVPGDAQKLLTSTRSEVEARGREALQLTTGRRDEIVKYVVSGQVAADAWTMTVELLKNRAGSVYNFFLTRWEDNLDWFRLKKRGLGKWFAKYF